MTIEWESAFHHKRVLITGHTGFKGGWLSIWLHMLGADVYGYALAPIHPQGIFNASGIGEKIHDIRGDIRDKDRLYDVFNRIEPEIVFHLAAQPIVIEGYKSPAETFEINIQGTVNLLEAIRKSDSVKAIVVVTSDKCYENREWIWGYKETDPMGGSDPYSASKAAAELVTNAYRRSFFYNIGAPAIATARAGNVIGGGDWAEHRLIPDIFRAIERGDSIKLRNPSSIRPWQHVLEPLCGYLLLASKLLENPGKYAEAWNFGPFIQDVRDVKEITESIIRYLGKGKWEDISDQNQLLETNHLNLDITKAVRKLGWRPVLNFEDSIRFTADWYMNYRKSDAFILSQKQIFEYRKKFASES